MLPLSFSAKYLISLERLCGVMETRALRPLSRELSDSVMIVGMPSAEGSST